MKYLLDADTLCAALCGRLPVVTRLARIGPGHVAVSAVSRMQVEIGLRKRPEAQQRYGRLLKSLIAAVRTLEFGEADAAQAATLGAYLVADEKPIGTVELMLAAQAMTHGHTLVVTDLAPYRLVAGLNIENWASTAQQSESSQPHKDI